MVYPQIQVNGIDAELRPSLIPGRYCAYARRSADANVVGYTPTGLPIHGALWCGDGADAARIWPEAFPSGVPIPTN